MKKISGNVLVIDDDPDILQTARVVLRPQFGKVETESNPQKIPFLLNHNKYDVILLDMNFRAGETSGSEGLSWLQTIMEKEPNQNVIMMTAYGQIKLAVEAMKIGACDFVVKPWENEKLLATVYAAINLSKSRKEVAQLKSTQAKLSQVLSQPSTEIVGESDSLREVFTTVEKVAATDASVLILGENGTGKELAAKAIHNQSPRVERVFIKVDLGAIPETLFESELFGHVKGAFTDAKEDRAGRFEVASGGTLFLDEVANLSLPLQAKLLSVLQNREIFRVGSNQAIPIDIRLVCATNASLQELVSEKKFREDLLYRLNTVILKMPPLRERRDDIPLLAKHFVGVYGQKYRKPDIALAKEAYPYLQKYQWPGNVRELQHAIERAVIMSDDSVLRKTDFILGDFSTSAEKPKSVNLDEVEKQAIQEAINKNRGNMSKAAKELGLGRTTLYRKIQKYGL